MKQLFTIVCLLLVQFSNAQQALRWVVEGSLHNATVSQGVTYSLDKSQINSSNYHEGLDPVLWGMVITRTASGYSDTSDFEIIVESDNMLGSGERQLTVYSADSSMDFQTYFERYSLKQHFRLRVNFFEVGTRKNVAYQSGMDGTPKEVSIGFSRPNGNSTNVGRLHAAEMYYVEDPNTNSPIGVTVVDSCHQIDTFVTGLVGSDLQIAGEDLQPAWIQNAKNNRSYPYDKNSGRTYLHVLEAHNTCDANDNNTLQVDEASYNVYFRPMSSYIIGRQDIRKNRSETTGLKSAIGFYLAPSFEPNKVPILPVELTSFRGDINNKSVTLNWITESETNNNFFEVQHSTNGVDWTHVAQVQGQGNTQTIQQYNLYDAPHVSGINYYRLKQVDFDGNAVYSDILAIQMEAYTEAALRVFPNPTAGTVFFSEPLDLQALHIQVFNIAGQDVSSLIQYTDKQLELNNLPTGMYWIRIQNLATQQVYTQKVIKQ